MKNRIIIKGGGDLATGIAHRLHRSGFAVIITEMAQPTVIRRTAAFAQAVFAGETVVEGITARRSSISEIDHILDHGFIPVLIDPQAECIWAIQPQGLVDAIIAKSNTGTKITDAPVVIGVGPGFTAGVDVHAVVETARGHNLGRVYISGTAQPNTGIPGEIGGYTTERLLRAPGDGVFQSCCMIGDLVAAGDVVALVDGVPVIATISGIVRGLLYDGLVVHKGMKVGDIDPRCKRDHCFTISDKARAIGGGVLEALLSRGGMIWQ